MTAEREVFDAAETSELGIQDDIDVGVIQIKAETLDQINAALRRIDEGRYGRCLECGCEIAEVRLQALPFAIRCRSCEDARESANQRERTIAQRMGASAVFRDISE